MNTNEKNQISKEETLRRLTNGAEQASVEDLFALVNSLKHCDTSATTTMLDTESGEVFDAPVSIVLKVIIAEVLARALTIVVATPDEDAAEMLEAAPQEILKSAVAIVPDYIAKHPEDAEEVGNRMKQVELELMRRASGSGTSTMEA